MGSVAHLKKWLYLGSGLYLALMAVSYYFEFYYVALLPIAALFFWLAIYRIEVLLILITLFTPFSVNLESLELGGIGMYIPTEPLLFGVLLLFIFKALSGKSIDARIWKHPITWIVFAYLLWIAITCISSEYPIVSIKFLLAKCWFIAAFYFLTIHVFRDLSKMKVFAMMYLFPLFLVIIYAVTRHAGFGFDKDSSHWVMEPFFKDHTSYGAALALFLPMLASILLLRDHKLLLKIFLGIGAVILLTGLVLSYTRAAWLSVIGAGGILGVMTLRIPLRTFAFFIFLIGSFLYLARTDIEIALEHNKQESSDNLEKHVSSISNVSSDASNLERLNRWNCAFEMFKERPVFGWGPGTYQFVYAPFQRSKDKTIISTNEGDGGNAHSEYLGPLSEQGLPGMLIMIGLVMAISRLAFRLYYRIRDREIRLMILGSFLGLVTYFIHGALNNYLDTDKISVPFWTFISMLVAIDLFYLPQDEDAATSSIGRT